MSVPKAVGAAILEYAAYTAPNNLLSLMVWVWLAIDKEVFNQDKSAANCNERHPKIGVAHFFSAIVQQFTPPLAEQSALLLGRVLGDVSRNELRAICSLTPLPTCLRECVSEDF